MTDRDSSKPELASRGWRYVRNAGAIGLTAALLVPGIRELIDDDYPECGSVATVSTAHSPELFLKHDEQTYSFYMPESYIAEQEVTIVRGGIAGERDHSSAVTVRMNRDEHNIQHATTELPGSGVAISLEYDASSHALKTACTGPN